MKALRQAERGFGRINGVLLGGCRFATVALMVAISAVIVAGVFYRYVLNDALSWSEEVSKFLMVWLTFTGAPIALRHGGHVAVEILPNALPARLRQLMLLVTFLIILSLMTVFVYQGWVFAWNARMQIAATLGGGFSMIWVFLAIPVGGALMGLIAVELVFRALRGVAGDPEVLAEQHLGRPAMSGE
ncbi:MAG: TRAP transporter small permease [Geminicoccaceae bacterium]|nr:TRAP transporter small permease [Geminicoccaceae bacterium]